MTGARQILAVTLLGLRSLPQRGRSALVIVVALVCMTVPPLAILVLGASLRASYLNSGATDRVIILSGTAHRQVDSDVWPSLAEKVRAMPGIRSRHGEKLVDLQLSASFHPRKKTRPENGNIRLRGIGPLGFALRPELKLIAGRLPRPGSREVIVGEQAARKFADMDIGRSPVIAGRPWRIVGLFRTGANLDGDLICDAAVLKDTMHRATYDTILLSLKLPADLNRLRETLRPLPVTILKEQDYYAGLWRHAPKTALYVAFALLFMIGGGALAATSQSVYAAVSGRAREIVILRAIGFDGTAVVAAITLETVLLACAGGLIGAGIVFLWVDGYPYNGGLEGGVFRVTMTWPLVAVALFWSTVVAVMGAAWPTLKAARGTVTEAMRDL